MNVEKFLITLKSDVERLKVSPLNGDLVSVIHAVEIIHFEFLKEEQKRDYGKIRHFFRQVLQSPRSDEFFKRFKGNEKLKSDVLNFLNGPF
jgi:hypothetical protein